MPGGTKLLPEPMLREFYCHMASQGHNELNIIPRITALSRHLYMFYIIHKMLCGRTKWGSMITKYPLNCKVNINSSSARRCWMGVKRTSWDMHSYHGLKGVPGNEVIAMTTGLRINDVCFPISLLIYHLSCVGLTHIWNRSTLSTLIYYHLTVLGHQQVQ